jgi:hypothetical protein
MWSGPRALVFTGVFALLPLAFLAYLKRYFAGEPTSSLRSGSV